MANTFCGFSNSSRGFTIVCVGSLFLQSLWCLLISNTQWPIFYTVSLENGTVTKIVIDAHLPQVMNYIFAVFLPVVYLTMFLSAIYKKSEILFYAMITYIIMWTLLTVYSFLEEEKSCSLWCLFPYTISSGSKNEELNFKSKFFWSMIKYVLGMFYMAMVYDYVKELRRGYSTPGQVMSAK